MMILTRPFQLVALFFLPIVIHGLSSREGDDESKVKLFRRMKGYQNVIAPIPARRGLKPHFPSHSRLDFFANSFTYAPTSPPSRLSTFSPTLLPKGTAQPTAFPSQKTNLPSTKPAPTSSFELVGGPINASAAYRNSVSLSDKGNKIAIGDPFYDESNSTGISYNIGLIQIFEQQSGSWEKLESDWTGETYDDGAGSSVSLSRDGKMLAFGTASFSSNNNGYVKVFEQDDDEWNQKGNTLLEDSIGDEYGWRVSLSNDGQRLAVGASGYVRIYEFKNDWKQIGEDILGLGLCAVALSGDGNTVAVGLAYSDDEQKCCVRVYEWKVSFVSSQWDLMGEMTGINEGDAFGYVLAISGNGKVVIVGTNQETFEGGNYAQVYTYDDGWNPLGSPIYGNVEDSGQFGTSVSISEVGDRIVIGSSGYGSDGRGRASVYDYENAMSSWEKIGDIVGNESGAQAGRSVSISGDGDYVAIGDRKNVLVFEIV